MLKKRSKGIQTGGNAKRKRVRFIIAAGLVKIIIAIFITCLSLLSKTGFVQITSVEIAGAKTVSVQEIHDIAEQDLSGSWWYIFSKNNFLLYPKRTIESDLLLKYPTLSKVTFSMEGMHTLRIYITERMPYALGCDDKKDEITDEDVGTSTVPIPQVRNCFYIDSDGFVYAEAPHFSNGVYIHYYVASSNVSISKMITENDRFAFLKYVTDYMARMGLHVYDAAVLPGDDYLLKIQNPSVDVYMNDVASRERTMTYFSAFWTNQKSKNIKYIDLRFDKNIIYKQ